MKYFVNLFVSPLLCSAIRQVVHLLPNKHYSNYKLVTVNFVSEVLSEDWTGLDGSPHVVTIETAAAPAAKGTQL